jgi:glycolate oxidase
MQMPQPDQAVIDRRETICRDLCELVAADCVIDSVEGRRAYDSDGLSAYRQLPLAVVLPETVQQIAAVMKYCRSEGIKVVPRGSGTSLSGGALPLADAVLVGLGKFNRILEVDYANRCVVAQPGVTNLAITHAVQADGFYYAPDPSSQIACSVGGNVAENSGGVHCLKYGLTTNNLLGIELVTIDGEILRLGGKHLDAGDYDLMGVMTGSEGLLGIVSEVTLRILQKPATQRALLVGFDDTGSAAKAVGDVIGAGIIPAGMEMMDGLAINAAEDFANAGYPRGAAALLIIELDGPEIEVNTLIDRVAKIMDSAGASSLKVSNSEEERNLFWAGRKSAFPGCWAHFARLFMYGWHNSAPSPARYDGADGVA